MPKSVSELEQELHRVDMENKASRRDLAPAQAQRIIAEALVAILAELQKLNAKN